ncbi:MAG: sugar phosphate isomerase/epimerase [Planctomycetia bacterium]|nr:sugar phosphate isomerase/epimerase [Planctomycetia bacterium]
MIPALSQVCTLAAPLETDVADYAAAACRTIELWLGKVEAYLETHSAADLKRLLAEHEVSAPVASYQGGLLTSQGAARAEHWSHFGRRLALCRELGVQTLVVAADIPAPLDAQAVDRAKVSLKQAAQQAGEHGVRLALEFQAQAALCNNLQTAAALIEETASPHLGICLDLFHFHTGPSKWEDLAHVSPENLFHVQVCDLSGTARELAADGDRILPGEGDLPVAALIDHLRRIGYTGCVSVELMNPALWQAPPRQFAEIAMTALRRVLGQAQMS